MKTRILLALCFAASLGGCSTLQALDSAANGTASDVAPQAMITAKKALIATHGLHEAAADVAVAAANGGFCVGTCASKAKDAIDKSEAILLAADKLVALGDARGINAKVGDAAALIAQVQTLAGKN